MCSWIKFYLHAKKAAAILARRGWAKGNEADNGPWTIWGDDFNFNGWISGFNPE